MIPFGSRYVKANSYRKFWVVGQPETIRAATPEEIASSGEISPLHSSTLMNCNFLIFSDQSGEKASMLPRTLGGLDNLPVTATAGVSFGLSNIGRLD
jgi:hypothetical protein